jgi:hypothetical protein
MAENTRRINIWAPPVERWARDKIGKVEKLEKTMEFFDCFFTAAKNPKILGYKRGPETRVA